MKFVALTGFIAAFASGLAAQDAAHDEKGRQAQPPGAADMQKSMKQMQEQMRAMQAKQLDMLKTMDPKAYQAQKAAIERQEQIEEIMTKVREGKLSDSQAQSQLQPLVKENLKPDLEHVDDRISALEKKLEFWKQVKRDPDVLVRQRVEEMLGKRKPEAPMGIPF